MELQYLRGINPLTRVKDTHSTVWQGAKMLTYHKIIHNERIRKFWNVMVAIISMIQLGFLGYLQKTYTKCSILPLANFTMTEKSIWWENDARMISSAGLFLMLAMFYMTSSTYLSTFSSRPCFTIVSFAANALLTVLGVISFIGIRICQMPRFDVVCTNSDGKDFLHDVLIALSIFIVYWTFVLNQMHLFFESCQINSQILKEFEMAISDSGQNKKNCVRLRPDVADVDIIEV